jgi:uncharacterized protein YbjT (DUF2867 family)
MPEAVDVVTGAMGYIGRYITAQLLESGRGVKTITTYVNKPKPFGERVEVFPYSFDRPERLVETLRGVDTLYTTYWVRFERGATTFSQAVENTRILFRSAAEAGVRKIVHISVTNPSLDSPLPYYRGKAQQEEALKSLGHPYSIIRPTLVFGVEDILVNNIAWLIRKFPVFPIFGDGEYQVQPVFVGDLASIAIDCGKSDRSEIVDAIGPETYTFEQLARRIAGTLSRRVLFVKIPPRLGILLGKIIGLLVRDVILTQDELDGLMANLLTSSQPPNGETKFSTWVEENKDQVGTSYTSELARHFRWKPR